MFLRELNMNHDDDIAQEQTAELERLRAENAAKDRRIAELEAALRGAVDNMEYWFLRDNIRDYGESEYKTWRALGFGSATYRNAKAALSGGRE